MQFDRRLSNSDYVQHGEEPPDEGSIPSVWIDPAIRQNALYLTREQQQRVTSEAAKLRRQAEEAREREEHGEQEEHGELKGQQKQDTLRKRMPLPNPVTPIPPRASAQASQNVKVRPRYPRSFVVPEESDVTRIPTMPQPTMWQYESAQYEAESSLSSLSLVVSEPAPPPANRLEVNLAEINPLPEKQDTRASSLPSQALTIYGPPDIAKANTVPPLLPALSKKPATEALQINVKIPSLADSTEHSGSLHSQETLVENVSSWTAGRGANSPYARRIAGHGRGPLVTRRLPMLNPLDQLRWWLLYPGRIEFLLWLGGTLVLVSVTCLLLFVSVLSLGWISPNFSGNPARSTVPVNGGGRVSTTATPCSSKGGKTPCSVTTTSPTGLKLTQLTSGLLVQGMPLRLQGQGFSHNGLVGFTHDGNLPCDPGIKQADANGAFIVDIILGAETGAGTSTGSASDWGEGHHVIVAHDVSSNNSVSLNINLAPPAFGNNAVPTLAPVQPGATPTPRTGGNGGGNPVPTPGQTPVPVTPIATSPVPTPQPTQPVPTPVATQPAPTPAITPIPTKGITPTNTVTPDSKTLATPTDTATGPTGSSDAHLLVSGLSPVQEHPPAGSWLWILLLGYVVAMVLLGTAGLLHRSRSNLRR